MGIYVYTLRKDILEIDGMSIGRIAYAYKPGWGDSSNRVIQSLLVRSESARAALPDITLVAQCKSFTMKDGEYATVFECSTHMTSCYDYPMVWDEEAKQNVAKVAGYLVKRGRKLQFVKDEPRSR